MSHPKYVDPHAGTVLARDLQVGQRIVVEDPDATPPTRREVTVDSVMRTPDGKQFVAPRAELGFFIFELDKRLALVVRV